ncbi:hypothetical protein PoB_003380500 [Plakobranchus ocellatus]|uniref:Uncharacterized protein n=1 Tax=Plakobranchus ocellatus TaxID=259542 RepID=A0AAV4AGK1_9GAST|nr:hypothetical protein PoB_003380500 [Plakobranchus ocellatus]
MPCSFKTAFSDAYSGKLPGPDPGVEIFSRECLAVSELPVPSLTLINSGKFCGQHSGVETFTREGVTVSGLSALWLH